MNQVRLAKEGDLERLREIWKLSFGDEDSYINLFFTDRYQADRTVLLFQADEIAAMLTIIPVSLVGLDNLNDNAAMLYAIATHPDFRNKGLASQLIADANEYLAANNTAFSLLVPAEEKLFEFYYRQGYREGFYLREAYLTREMIARLPDAQAGRLMISAVVPSEYNRRRNDQLKGKLYIKYTDEDIAYQKKLSRQSGADIYAIDLALCRGCMVAERMSAEKVFIKEILIAEEFLNSALKQVAQLLEANEFIIRTPAYLGENLDGSIRPFAMFRVTGDSVVEITPESGGYLGLAFD